MSPPGQLVYKYNFVLVLYTRNMIIFYFVIKLCSQDWFGPTAIKLCNSSAISTGHSEREERQSAIHQSATKGAYFSQL